jgi:guanylate kinase
MKQRKNNAFLISAPSGAGKSSLIQLLLAEVHSLFFSISHTTRPPRPGEQDGVEYFFVSHGRFEEMIEANQFLEWAYVHGHYYGTSAEMVHRAEEQHKDLLLDVDIQGHQKVRKVLEGITSIFVLPPSYEALKERLEQRGKDTPEQIGRRMENARMEIRHYREYDYVVINDDLQAAFECLTSIIRSRQNRRENLQEKIEEILQSFGIPVDKA